MSVSIELSNPALQDIGEDDLSFNHFALASFDEEEPPQTIEFHTKEIKNLSFGLNVASVDEFKHTVFFNVETPEGLNWYCDRILEKISLPRDIGRVSFDYEQTKDGLTWERRETPGYENSLNGIIPVHTVEAVRRTWMHKYNTGAIVQPTPMKDRKVDDFGAWKKRGKKMPIQVSSVAQFDEPRNVSNLKLSEAWVVPSVAVKHPILTKPTVREFSQFLFKKWVHSVAQNLRLSLRKKSQRVVGNTAAHFLYQQSNSEIMHSSVLRRCLQESKIYVYDFSQSSKKLSKPTNWKISDFMPKAPEVKRVLYYGNRVMNAENVLEFEKFFKHHRPRFVVVCKYLRNESSPILAVLQQEVNSVYESNKPKLLCLHGQLFDRERIMRNQKNISAGLYKLCLRHFSGDKTVNFGSLQSQFSKLTLSKLQSGNEEEYQLLEDEVKEDSPPPRIMNHLIGDYCPVYGVPVGTCPCNGNNAAEWARYDRDTGKITEYGLQCIREGKPVPKDYTTYAILGAGAVLAAATNPTISSVVSDVVQTAKNTAEIGVGNVKDFVKSQESLSAVLDILLSIKSYMEEAGWLEPLKLITMLIALHHQTTWKGCLSVISMYAVSVDTDRWKDAFNKLRSFSPPVFRMQSGEEAVGEVPKGFSIWELISPVTEWGKELWSCLTELMWTTIGPCFVPANLWSTFSASGFTGEFIGRVKSELMKIQAKSVAEYVMQTLMHIFTLIKTCFRLKSLRPLFSTVFEPVFWRQQVVAIVTYFAEIQVSTDQPVNTKRWNELRSGGFIPSEWLEPFTPHALSILIDDLVKTGDQFLLTFRSDPVLRSDLKQHLDKLKALQEANSIGYGVMAQRVQPYGIYISGIAGSGKTNLSDAIFKSIGRANSYSIEPTMKYSWQKGVNFQDSLGFSQWCITLDDIDTSPAPPTMGFESHVDAVIRIINNAPLVVEQSRVEAKGKVAAKPLLVMMTSNFEEARLREYALKPTKLAFYRRFPLWIKVRAKDEFGSNGVLDKDKAATSKDGEILHLEVFVFDSSILDDFPYKSLGIMSKSALLKFCISDYRKHMDQQLTMLMKSSGGAYCPECYADWKDGQTCSCKSVPQMKWEFLIFPTVAAMLYRWIPPIYQREKLWLTDVKKTVVKTIDNFNEATYSARLLIEDVKISKDYFNERVDKFFNFDVKVVAAAALFIGLMNLAWKYYSDEEKLVYAIPQMMERNAVAGAVPTSWIRAPQEYRPGMPVEYSTFTKEDAISHIRDSYVTVRTARGSIKGIVVSNNGVICPLHVFVALGEFTAIPEFSDITFEVIQKGITHKLLYNVFNVTQIHSDSVFIKVPGLVGYTGVGKKFWIEVDNMVSQFDELLLVRSEEIVNCQGISTTFNSNRIVKCNAQTVDGDCGYVYLARMNKHWKIVAMHTAQNLSSAEGFYAYGIVLTQNAMLAAAARLAIKFQMVSIPLKQTGLNYEKQTFSYYPPKSEIWAAVSHYGVEIAPIGQADIKVHGSTIKSDIRPTLYASEFEDLEIEWCGRADYWQTPNFKGEMRDGKWVSPYINSLTPLKRVCHKQEFLYLALMEYMSGVEDLRRDGYSEISLEEALVGIPGSVIQAADLKTSVGMPFNQPKTTKIVVRDRQAFTDPEFMSVVDEIKSTIEKEIIACPIVLCQLKDEAISWKKNMEKEARVFNVLTFAYNWVMKSKLAPLECFLRANRAFFGSMVGINMTSLEINDVVRILARTDPELKRIIALDIRKEDKSIDGHLIDLIGLVFWAITMLLGGDAETAYILVQGLKSGVFIIKNDVFQLGATNLSGQDKTVTWNCIVTSIALIYFYYRMKYGEQLPDDLRKHVINYQRNFFQLKGIVPVSARSHLTFRSHVSKGTYGDDSLQSISKDCSFYDVNKIPDLGLELGMVFTDEAKTDQIEFRSITECSFLKRTFVWREDLQSYVGRLSLKTLAKMLRMRKKSTLTDRDHAAEQLTNVLRELAYYTRQEYDTFKERAISVATKYGLIDNAYFRAPSYDEYFQQMKEGSFSTWAPIVPKKD